MQCWNAKVIVNMEQENLSKLRDKKNGWSNE